MPNPALAKMVADASAKHEAKNANARELLLNLIGNTFERLYATPDTVVPDYRQEGADLLGMIEQWCVKQRDDDYLIFRDPADDVVTLEP